MEANAYDGIISDTGLKCKGGLHGLYVNVALLERAFKDLGVSNVQGTVWLGI